MNLAEAIVQLNKHNLDITFLSDNMAKEIGHDIVVEPDLGSTNDSEYFDSVIELIEYAERLNKGIF